MISQSSGSRGPLGRRPFAALCAVGVALSLACATSGCGDGSKAGGSDAAPTVTSATVAPTVLETGGGDVTVRAQVTSGSPVAWVRATITQPDGGQVTLEMTTAATTPGVYEAAFTAQASPGTGEQVYSVTVSASNQAGQASQPVSAGSVRVTASDGGPPPPPPL